jgi:hypothetical protein
MQLLDPEDLINTLEDGKMPPVSIIIEKIQQRQEQAQVVQPIQPNGGI